MTKPPELGPLLSEVGIKNVITMSGNQLRHRALESVVGKSIPIEHRKGSDAELGWDPQYLRLCRLFGITPNQVGYQMLTGLSKPEVRLSQEEFKSAGDQLIVSADTIILTEELKPFEKPKNTDEAFHQLYRLLNGHPYLISTMVAVMGTGAHENCIAFASHNLPVVRIVPNEQRDSEIKKLIEMGSGGFYSKVPGLISHNVPEVSENTHYYVANDPNIGLDIYPTKFFDRGTSSLNTPKSVLACAESFDDQDSMIIRQVKLTPTKFSRKKYINELNSDINHMILGAPEIAFYEAVSKWVRMVESNYQNAITNPMRNLLMMRTAVKQHTLMA